MQVQISATGNAIEEDRYAHKHGHKHSLSRSLLWQVQISVDLNPACSTGADDTTDEYNQVCRHPQISLQYLKKSPYVPLGLPTVGPMDHSHMGH